MKTYFILLCLLLSIAAGFAQNTTQKIKEIDQFLQQEYPKNEPGATVLIAQNGEILYKKALGLASLRPKRKLKADMVFPIASMSKQFVSAAILQLVEAGKMSLTDPIQKYVPYYPNKKYKVTIHHLLSQTSGIPDYFDVDENEFYLLSQKHTPKQLITYYKEVPLSFEPGTAWQYSNSNYPLLGAALENVTGISLQEYLQKNLFDPLNMSSTGLWYRTNTKKKQIPQGYNIKQGQFVKGPEMVGSALYAPGGIVSSVEDLYLWNRAMRAQNILSQFVVDQLTIEKKLQSGKGTGYGYGFFLRELQGSKTIEHGGILFSFTSGGLYLPNEDIFVCILSNSKYDRVQEVSNYIASVLLNKPLKIYTKKEISAKKLKEYVGAYVLQDTKLERTFQVKVFDNVLLLHDPKAPQNDAKLTPSGNDIFLLKGANASFQFNRNAKGTISGYTVQQGDQIYKFQKMNP